MPNILDRYPGATIEVWLDGELIAPADYAAHGIALTFPNGRQFRLSAPNFDGEAHMYEVRFTPPDAVADEPVRLTRLEFPDQQPGLYGPGDATSYTQLVTPIPPGPAFEIYPGGDWSAVSVYGGREGT